MHAHPTRAHILVNPTTGSGSSRVLPFERIAHHRKEVAAAEQCSGRVARIAERHATGAGDLALAPLRLRQVAVGARSTAQGVSRDQSASQRPAPGGIAQ
jgi:hypothetical protein